MTTRPSQNPSHLTPQEIGKPQSPELKCLSLRLSHLCGATLLAFVILHSSLDIASAASPPELTVLRQQYDKAYAERVTAVFDASKAALDAKFTTALDNAIATAKASGDLPTVLAIQEDKKAIEAKQDLPADADTTPAALKTLRAIYREQVSKLTEQRTANTDALLTPYTAKLQQLEGTLTKNDRVEEAKEVMDYRVSLAQSGPLSPLSGAPPSTGSPSKSEAAQGTVRTTMAPATTPKVKGDDRKAAEWVLSVGGTVRLWDNSTGIVVNSADKLPKGDFSIRSITCDNNKGGIRPFTDADFAVLSGLERLDMVNLNKLTITAAGMKVLGTCPKLQTVTLQYNGFGDGLWSYLSGVTQMIYFQNNYDTQTVTGEGISQMGGNALTGLDLGNTALGDVAMREIAAFKEMKRMILEVTKITDEGIRHLAALKKLERLNVRNTDVTPSGLANLKELPLIQLGYGRTIQDTAAGAAEVAALFPKLEALVLPRDGNPTAEEWSVIAKAWPKLKRLYFNSRKLDDASCAGMLPLAALEEIDFLYCPITDVGIASLAQLRKLFWLSIPDAKITDAALETLAGMKPLKYIKLPKPGNGITADGIAKFKKQRPDVKVE